MLINKGRFLLLRLSKFYRNFIISDCSRILYLLFIRGSWILTMTLRSLIHATNCNSVSINTTPILRWCHISTTNTTTTTSLSTSCWWTLHAIHSVMLLLSDNFKWGIFIHHSILLTLNMVVLVLKILIRMSTTASSDIDF